MPDDEPASIPSRRNSSRAVSKLSASEIVKRFAARATDRRSAAMKSSPIPSTSHEPAVADLAGPNVVGQDRADRIGQHHFDVRRHAGEEAAQARERAARSDAAHHRIQPLRRIAARSPGPVVVSWASGLAGLLNWLT